MTPLPTLPNTGLGDIPRKDWINVEQQAKSLVDSLIPKAVHTSLKFRAMVDVYSDKSE